VPTIAFITGIAIVIAPTRVAVTTTNEVISGGIALITAIKLVKELVANLVAGSNALPIVI